MTARKLARALMSGLTAVAIVAFAASPALAQQSSLRGKVVDEAGNPVEGAEIVITPTGGAYDVTFTATTNDKGEWFKGGLAGYGGVFKVTVTKGELSGAASNVRASLGQVTSVEDIVIKPAGLAAFENDPTNLTAEEIEKRNAETEALRAAFDAAGAAFEAGDYDTAITNLNTVMAGVEDCGPCYAFLGDVQLKKGDQAAAEAAYQKAIELEPNDPGPYNGLASIYNQQRKFEEAAEMSAKAAELSAAAAPPAGAAGEAGEAGAPPAGGGGAGSAAASYNQGISLWNAGKAAEAQAAFERAIGQDPKMADAHYWLGMAFVNQGKLKEAKTPFETYLKLAPDGENAATAKALLAQIGG